MRACVLCTGSKGNSVYVELDEVKILIDTGKSLKYIKESLESIDVNICDINYVFITHNHNDHVSSLKSVLRKSNAALCISEELFSSLKDINDYDKIIYFEDKAIIDDIVIDCLKSSHDAPDSRNYVINYKEKRFAYITDTGYVNQRNFKKIHNADILLMESNHDVQMLQDSLYYPHVKKRIISDVGHLSNNQAGFYLTKLIGPNTKDVVLVHLSEDTNTPSLALETVVATLKEHDIIFNNIICSSQHERSEVYSYD